MVWEARRCAQVIRSVKRKREKKGQVESAGINRHRVGDATIPHEVVGLVVEKGWNLAGAWRKYLGMSQKELAKKAGISQPALSRMERSDNLRDATLEKPVMAMGLRPEQLVD